jgi:glutaredoxin 3
VSQKKTQKKKMGLTSSSQQQTTTEVGAAQQGSSLNDFINKSQKPVVMFSTPTCPYCNRAKSLLQKLQIEYDDFNVDADGMGNVWNEIEKNFTETVPAIWINKKFEGGFTEISKLNDQGKLRRMVSSAV